MLQTANPGVVVVEDDDLVRTFFEDVLTDDGYDCRSFSRGSPALEHLGSTQTPVGLILSDINMPGMNGLEFLRAARMSGCRTPFVMVSGTYELPLALDAIGDGAADYLLKPASPEEILNVVSRHSSPHECALRSEEEAVASYLRSLSSHSPGPQLARLLNALSEKRIETLQHSIRVAAYTLLLARKIGGAPDLLNHRELELGAMLHDIGKVGVPENVVMKAGPLNSDEWRIMKMHPSIGHELLRSIPGMDGVAEIVYSHHEAFDGTGYPLGTASKAIPLGARVFSVVDAFDAMTSDRPYRKARSVSAARGEIAQNGEIAQKSGLQFDPSVVEKFLEIPEAELEVIRKVQADRRP
jgi:putative two-component system response regulator